MSKINTMVIPAAGYGTRMREITRGGSKELVEIGGKPAIMYALQEAVDAGLSRAGIVIRTGKEDIADIVGKDPRLAPVRANIQIRFFYQEQPTGEAGAIAAASEWLGDAPFVVHYPDNIIAHPRGIVASLITQYLELETDLVLLTPMTEHVQVRPCGLKSAGHGLYMLRTDQMPAAFPYGLRSTGIYVASGKFLHYCKELVDTNQGKEIKDGQVRSHMLFQGYTNNALDLDATVLDIGNSEGYWKAARLFS